MSPTLPQAGRTGWPSMPSSTGTGRCTAAGTRVAVAPRDVPQVCHHCLVPSVLRPELVDFQNLTKSNARHNLEHAFSVAERHLGITPLLDPEGEAIAANPPASVSPGTFPGSMERREAPNTRKEVLGGHRRDLMGLWWPVKWVEVGSGLTPLTRTGQMCSRRTLMRSLSSPMWWPSITTSPR